MPRFIPVFMCCCAGALTFGAQAATRRVPETGAAADLPFSAAVEAGDFIYVTGNGGGKGDIGAQTQGALDNIAEILKKAGATLNDVVSTQVYISDRANAAGMDAAYGASWSANPPARTVIITEGLVGGNGLVEINAVAVRHGVSHKAVLPHGWQQPTGPFSYGQKVGNTLFISALTGRNPMDGSASAPDNVRAQTKTIMESMGALLKAASMDYGDIAAGRVWISDITKNYESMNAVYRSYFIRDFPSRATLEFNLANPADIVEISAVAVKGGPRHAIAATITADGTPGTPNPNFCAGMVVGNRMWITGMTGQTADNKTDLASQTNQALATMLRVVKAGGFTQEQVVEVNVYLHDAHDVSQYQLMNTAYKKVFQKDFPARTTVQGDNAGKSLVEIVMMAAR